jgi:hypothetical protein
MAFTNIQFLRPYSYRVVSVTIQDCERQTSRKGDHRSDYAATKANARTSRWSLVSRVEQPFLSRQLHPIRMSDLLAQSHIKSERRPIVNEVSVSGA